MEAIMRSGILTVFLAAAVFVIGGCDKKSTNCGDPCILDLPPQVPQGVYSITGDEEVLISWIPIDDIEGDFKTYVVYRSDYDPDTGYYEIGRTTSELFVDQGVVNGYTYYYAVSSLDWGGNLSALSYEYVFDTPRPQGINGILFDYNLFPDDAGWNLAAATVVNYLVSDFYLEYYAPDDVFYLNVGNIDTDIQDMGYTYDFDEIGYSPGPGEGWSQNGWLEVILHHTYIIWTDDNRYAKIRITGTGTNQILFNWAFQEDFGNRELKPRIERAPDYLRNPQVGE
jgi:hypothetical protein